MNLRRYFLHTTAVLFAATLWTGCYKDDDDCEKNTYTLSGNASGANERPKPAETPAVGTIAGTYNKESNIMHYTIVWHNLTVDPVGMHFHGPATPDSAAGVQIPITGFSETKSGTVSGMETLSDEQETQLLNGLWYYNIHTTTYPAGEIRGNIKAKAD